MKLTLDIRGIYREVEYRGRDGFFEGALYYRTEEDRKNAALADIYIRVTAMARTSDGGLFLCECLELCGRDENGSLDGTEAAGKHIAELCKACDDKGIEAIEGRLEMM